jgi:hypothetical protein
MSEIVINSWVPSYRWEIKSKKIKFIKIDLHGVETKVEIPSSSSNRVKLWKELRNNDDGGDDLPQIWIAIEQQIGEPLTEQAKLALKAYLAKTVVLHQKESGGGVDDDDNEDFISDERKKKKKTHHQNKEEEEDDNDNDNEQQKETEDQKEEEEFLYVSYKGTKKEQVKNYLKQFLKYWKYTEKDNFQILFVDDDQKNIPLPPPPPAFHHDKKKRERFQVFNANWIFQKKPLELLPKFMIWP